jgi:hypothetical protein
MGKKYREDEDALIVEEIQSFLKEKRTALKAVRMRIPTRPAIGSPSTMDLFPM